MMTAARCSDCCVTAHDGSSDCYGGQNMTAVRCSVDCYVGNVVTAARCSVDCSDSNSMRKRLLLWTHHDGSLMLSEVNRLWRQIGAHGTAMLDLSCS